MPPTLQWYQDKVLWTPAGKVAVSPDCCCYPPPSTCLSHVYAVGDGCLVLPDSVVSLPTLIAYLGTFEFDVFLPDLPTSGFTGTCVSVPCSNMNGEILTLAHAPGFGDLWWRFSQEAFCPPNRSCDFYIQCYPHPYPSGDLTCVATVNLTFITNGLPTNVYVWRRLLTKKLILEAIGVAAPYNPFFLPWESTFERTISPLALCSMTGTPPIEVRIH